LAHQAAEALRIAPRNGESENLPYSAQWLGLIATILGAAFGAASVVSAWIAAGRAKGAREAAEGARQAATRAGRIAQLGDLIADMQELQAMLARMDFAAIAGKANLLRGRIVRFKAEGYNDLGEKERENLDLAREQLQIMARVAATSKATDQSRAGRIQLGYGDANEALNSP
jgi:hypothetical protein